MNIPPFRAGEGAIDRVAKLGAKEMAQRAAEIIMKRWHEAGHKNVRAWVETVTEKVLRPVTHRDGTTTMERFSIPIPVIRSNLVGGLPPMARAIAA